jgi:hypothetical protein
VNQIITAENLDEHDKRSIKAKQNEKAGEYRNFSYLT